MFEKSITELNIKKRTVELLESFNIKTIDDLIRMKESELGALDGIGLSQVRKIEEALAEINLSLEPELPKEEKVSNYNKINSDKYRKKIKRFTLQFNIKDAEARAWFEQQDNPGDYLKGLILKDKAERRFKDDISSKLSQSILEETEEKTEIIEPKTLPPKKRKGR